MQNVVSGYKIVQIWGKGQIIGSHRQTNGKMARCLLLIIIVAFVCVVSSNYGIKHLILDSFEANDFYPSAVCALSSPQMTV